MSFIPAAGVYDLRWIAKLLARRRCGRFPSIAFQAAFSRAVKGLVRRGILEPVRLVPVEKACYRWRRTYRNQLEELADGTYLKWWSRQIRRKSYDKVPKSVKLDRGGAVNIVQAFSDPQLFRPWFQSESWDSWRAFLCALFALPMDEGQLRLYRIHTERQNAPTKPFREAWVLVGRRGGKSLIAALVAVYLACFRQYKNLAPGETGTVMILASDRRQCRVIFNYITAFLEVPMLKRLLRSELKESIELTNKIKIEIHTSSFRSVREYTIVAAICDEIAFWPNEDSSNPDLEVIAALRPAMLTVPGALLLAISSPYARRGVIWQAYKEHYGQDSSDVLVWKADTRSMNPSVPESLIEAAYQRDEASSRAEYGAEFRSDIESFLSSDVIETCVISGRHELPPTSSTSYLAFTDPSGGHSDSFTLAIAHRQKEVAVLDVIREVPPPFSPESVVKDFCELLMKYRISTVYGDTYAGEWPREAFAKRGVSYKTSELVRSEIYLELLPIIMSGRVELLDSKRLIAQLVLSCVNQRTRCIHRTVHIPAERTAYPLASGRSLACSCR